MDAAQDAPRFGNEDLDALSDDLRRRLKRFEDDLPGMGLDAAIEALNELLEEEARQRFAQLHSQDGTYRRKGFRDTVVVLRGMRATVKRPRIATRDGGGEVALAIMARFKPAQQRRRQAGVWGDLKISTRDATTLAGGILPGVVTASRSTTANDRRKAFGEALATIESRRCEDVRVLIIDGLDVRGLRHMCITAIGITEAGEKLALALKVGQTESAEVVGSLLADLKARGLPSNVLVIIDGSAGSFKAIRDVLGLHVPIQRCRVHKARRVLAHVPKEHEREVKEWLWKAWRNPSHAEASSELDQLAQWLDARYPAAADSLRTDLAETLTLQLLGIEGDLARVLGTTNAIESAFADVRAFCRRVKRWLSQDAFVMVRRWIAAALLQRERRTANYIRGIDQIPDLITRLERFAAAVGEGDVAPAPAPVAPMAPAPSSPLGALINLTRIERRLFDALGRGTALTGPLLSAVWPDDASATPARLGASVRGLRKKLGEDVVLSVKGGYRLHPDWATMANARGPRETRLTPLEATILACIPTDRHVLERELVEGLLPREIADLVQIGLGVVLGKLREKRKGAVVKVKDVGLRRRVESD